MTTVDVSPARVDRQPLELPPIQVGDDRLTAAYCAERAARCLHEAEAAGTGETQFHLLAVAEQWAKLGASMASNTSMNRPRKRDDDDERR